MKYMRILNIAFITALLTLPAYHCAAADSANNCTIELNNVDAITAINVLFKESGKSLTFVGNVNGMIPSLHLKDVDFDFALRIITRACGLVFRIIDGSYEISPKTKLSVPVGYDTVNAENKIERAVKNDMNQSIEKINFNHTGPTVVMNHLGNKNGDSNTNARQNNRSPAR